jgi:hypothetical protein
MIAEGFPSPPPSQYQPRFFCKSGQASRWTVYARVWNIGPPAAPGVALRVYAAWNDYNIWSGGGSTNFSKFQLIGGTYLNPGIRCKGPTKLDISETVRWLGYKPAYSLANLLSELAAFGDAGPPHITGN